MDIWMWLRSCARCSSYLPPVDLLCERCWADIADLKTPRTRTLFSTLEVFSLWDWRAETDDIGEMIKKRKSAHFDHAHRRLAHLLLRGENASLSRAKTLVYPSKNVLIRDHTASLAEACAGLLNIPAVPVPIWPEENYKIQGQKERFQKRRAQKPSLPVTYPVVFIDDVLTTGATARAVWKALGRPREFSASVLVYKTRKPLGISTG